MSASVVLPFRAPLAVPRGLLSHLPSARRPDLPGVDRHCIATVRREHPDLAPSGFWCADGFLTPQQFETNRARMTDDQHTAEFRRALAFLLVCCTRRRELNRRATSYGLKHQAERVMRTAGQTNPYVSNGMFLAAAITLGFRVEPIPRTPNAWTNAYPKRESRR